MSNSSIATLTKLADFQDRRAAFHLANGNTERAAICEKNAASYKREIAERQAEQLKAEYPLTVAAFPDFDLTTMPRDIPAGFVESSYANDTCPSFWNEQLKLSIHVDYVDSDLREFEGGERFHLLDTENGESVISSDEFAEIVAAIAEIESQITVKDADTATAFLNGLHGKGLAFHPDDRASDCLRDCNLSRVAIQAIQINMRATFAFVDPYEILLDLINA
jgi:hypothetical protein